MPLTKPAPDITIISGPTTTATPATTLVPGPAPPLLSNETAAPTPAPTAIPYPLIFTITIQANDSLGNPSPASTLTFSMYPPLVVSGGPLSVTFLDVNESYVSPAFSISGGFGEYSFRTPQALVKDLSLCGTGQIFGKVSAPSNTTYMIIVSDENNAEYAVGPNRIVSGLPDCDNPAYGPNGRACAPGAKCIDGPRFDEQFTCDCESLSNVAGPNCDAVTSSSSSSLSSGALGGIAAGILVLLLVVVLIIYLVYRVRNNKPHDFEEELRKMIESGRLREETLHLSGSMVPKEIPRSSVRTLERLGAGAFGDVNKGLYRPGAAGTEVIVAIKVLKENPTREERGELMKEATLMAQFAHPNVIGLVGVVTAGDPAMLIVQFAEKGALNSMLKSAKAKGRTLAQGLRLRMSLDCAAGLAYLQSLGFVHRDVAARNVLVDSAYACKIADFGMARDMEDSDCKSSVVSLFSNNL